MIEQTNTTFTQWMVAEHHPITGVPPADHRVSLWYEENDRDMEGEELLTLTYWQINAIWEGLRLYEEVAKARLNAASVSGQRDLRAHGKVVESCVMAKRKISSVRRYMASKHQKSTSGSIEDQIINRAVGVTNEGTTGED